MLKELINSRMLRGYGTDTLRLTLLDDAYEILGYVFSDGEDTAMPNRRVGAKEHYVPLVQ